MPSIDLLPRLLVHTVLGDYTIDPWSTGHFDLSRYGVVGYDFQTDPATNQFTVILHHQAGDIVLQPFAPGPPTDLSGYGITSYEVVFGVPPVTNPLAGNLTGFLVLGLIGAAAWMWAMYRPRRS